ncbi:MAG: hypothetical protein BWY73_00760 [candidate division TA06 bacterium ADurb.Bin417]|uniref:Uncharacterized protein n=1 Tax=candidate division TA06 bacterium ADurb.Bin417 TaxID=1852828 RepID=A0A1V5MHX5_UNCT6|nr:MAG: hypothetical protein BWY73_00760 [candidate division TA06 bacterium ADurb.Bin417]
MVEITGYDEAEERFLRERQLYFEKTARRLLVFSGRSEESFAEITGRFCRGGCTLRMANLEDVFLKLTGRELKE